jgi:hypothetical protein
MDTKCQRTPDVEGSDQWIKKIDELPPKGQLTVAKVWLWRSEKGSDAIQTENEFRLSVDAWHRTTR